MNNTLTGLGLALVLALVAALVGPWFVNWSAYRDDIARQASALIGAPVRLTGAVDVRLLPTPYLRLRGLTSGEGAARLTVDEAELELGVAPLLRGEVKAERVKLVRPRLGVEVAADGAVRTAFSAGPGASAASDRVSFQRVEIVDGAVTVTRPGATSHLARVTGQAEVGSLSGPFRFDGRFSASGETVEAQLSTARADDKGAMRIKLGLGAPGAPPTVEADGALTLGPKPAFDGRIRASDRSRRAAGAAAPEPWSLAAGLKSDARLARLENVDFGFGPEDRGIRLSGRGEIALGTSPRVDLTLQSRQADLDRLLGENRPKAPVDVLKAVAGRLGLSATAPIDGRISLDLRGLVLGGDVAQDVAVEAETGGGAWRIRRLSAKLPGGSALQASGAVAPAATGAAFVGDVDFTTADLAGLRDWLLGGGTRQAAPIRRLALKGEVAAGPQAIAIEDAELRIGDARSTGRLAWRAPGSSRGRAKLEAALVSELLDLDALGVDRLLAQALGERPMDVVLALDAKRLTLAGVEMKDVSLDGSADAGGLELKRLDIRDAGGVRASGSGRVAPGSNGPEGRLAFHVVAERLAPLLRLARAAGAPEGAVSAIERRAPAIAPLDLEISFENDGDAQKLVAAGKGVGGALEVRLAGRDFAYDAPLELDLKATSTDGRRLAALAGLDLSPVVAASGGEISLRLAGTPAEGMKGEGRVKAVGLDLEGRGEAKLAATGDWSVDGDLALQSNDLGPALAAIGRLTPGAAPPLPARLASKAKAVAEGLRFDEVTGEIAGRRVHAQLAVPFDAAKPFKGAVEFDEAPLAALFAVAASPDALDGRGDARSVWPSAAFGAAPMRGIVGRLAVKAGRMPLGQGEPATGVGFDLDLRPNAVAAENLAASFAGGRMTGKAVLARKDDDESTLSLSLQLDDAQVERLLGASAPARGRVSLRAEAQGTGGSIAAIVGSLAGAGTATFADGVVRRLDASAIDRIEPKIEAGLPLEAPAVAGALEREFAAADLGLERAALPFTISSGVIRASEISAESGGLRIGGGLSLDLRRLALDADLTLQPARPDAPQIGMSLHGPWLSPERRLDATSFVGWLSVRAVERETRRIEAMEADIKERARIARERAEAARRAEEEKRRLEEEKRRVEEEKRKAEAERRKREAEARAAAEAPRPTFPRGLPLDITPPGAANPEGRAISPPTGVFGGQGAGSNGSTPPQPAPPTVGAPVR